MADKRVTDLDPIVIAPVSGVMHFVDTTDTTQNAAGSSFKVTKEDFLKENTAAILLNTAKVGISVAQAVEIEANNAKVGISTPQADAIVLNTAKVGFTDSLVSNSTSVTSINLKETGLNTCFRNGTKLPRVFKNNAGATGVPITSQFKVLNPSGLTYAHKFQIFSTTTGTSFSTNDNLIKASISNYGISFWYDYDAALAIQTAQPGDIRMINYIKTNSNLSENFWNIVGTTGVESTTVVTTSQTVVTTKYKILEKKTVSGKQWAYISFLFSVSYLTANTSLQSYLLGFNKVSQVMKNNGITLLIANFSLIEDVTEYITPYVYDDISGRKGRDTIAGSKYNSLFNKIYNGCGDSVTNGTQAGFDALTADSLSYGYYITERNNGTFINSGIDGSTMQDIAGRNGFAAANGRYTQLDTDSQFITILFGINDAANGTLGTITDTDPSASFYGAFNTVLPYLLNKHNIAKIGLITPYGATAGHRQAVKDMGKKWGVAVLDLYDENEPLVFGRESGSIINSPTVTAWKALYLADGTHPNALGNRYISSIIESFLKSI
jgi:lysophospholipase L1-like esterase